VNRIAGYASYLPRPVLTREAAREAWPRLAMPGNSRTVPGLDEDALTMAAQAGLDALSAAGVAGASLSAVFVATSSSPYVVKSGAAIVADYVGAGRHANVTDFGAGAHGGLVALLSALRDTALAERGPILVVGADAVFGPANDPSDLGFGAGACAFVVGADGFVSLERFDYGYSSYSYTWQPVGETHLHRYDDERFERTAGYTSQMAASLRDFLEGATPDWYALSLTPGVRADALGVPADRLVGAELAAEAGDSGCANVLLTLAAALERASASETIVVQGYGSGAGTASALLAVESAWSPAVAAAPRERVELSYVQYAKHRGLIPLSSLPSFGAAYGASPGWERGKHASVGLHAGRCRACGSLNFPPRVYCLDCRGQEFEDVALPRQASVLTFNLQYVVGIAPEEAPLPICTALVDGERPGRYGGKVAALVTDVLDVSQISIGTPVQLVPRRADVEDGLVNYGWKFRPRAGSANGQEAG